MFMKIIWLAGAGALGALSRYGLGELSARLFGTPFPWGTFLVNALGCFLFGVVGALAEEQLAAITPELRTIILAGFMGAFTTFSTFIFETGEFMRTSQWLLAAGNLTAQILAGLIFLYVGAAAGRLVLG